MVLGLVCTDICRLFQIQNCRVVCICGDKTSRLVSYCNSIGLKNIYTDWQEMLNNEDLDAITLAVPPNIQYKIAKFAASKSLHIFAEKPLAINLKQAKHLLELAGKNKIVTAVDFIFPEIEEWQAVKKILEEKIWPTSKYLSCLGLFKL